MGATVVIPAYNEAAVIGRLLDALTDAPADADLDVVVVCNGCTDDTARIAREHPLGARVAELATGSKHLALLEGDRLAGDAYPRFYVDADIVVTGHDVRRLADALGGGVLAVSPGRHLDLSASSRLVRSYYRIWERLPAVRDGLYGRGVLGVGAEGGARLLARPEVLGDDLWFHTRFADGERAVAEGVTSVVHGPRTTADLVRRRIRAAQGNRQLRRAARGPGEGGHAPAGTSVSDVARIVRQDPARSVDALVFLALTVVSRGAGRLRRRASWLRDEGSRA